MDSFQFACKNFKGNTENADIAATIGFESNKEYTKSCFLGRLPTQSMPLMTWRM